MGEPMPEVTWQPIRVETGSSEEDGRLMLVDGKLVAVLVRLSDEHPHPELHEKWFVEAGCGPIFQRHEVFSTFEDAVTWIAQTVEHRTQWRAKAEQAKLENHYPR
jgi:hypothetical protein